MAKIVIIGAGSGFGGQLSVDILARPSLADSTIALCDINADSLRAVTQYVQRVIDRYELPGKVVAGTDRRELLGGADFVITSVSVAGPAYWGLPYKYDIEIPQQYGIEQHIGDTIGPGGVFRFLRTAPVQLEFCRDIERLCPDAWMLNHTNPMAMLTWLHSAGSSVRNVGLCHSVQGTTEALSRWAGAPYEEVSYHVAGINHQAWVLRLEHKGQDLYPRVHAAFEADAELARREGVRYEIMKQFGRFVTESSRHNSEYLPYFRRTPELLEHYALERRVVGDQPKRVREWMKDMGVEAGGDPNVPELTPSKEYTAAIIQGIVTDTPTCFNGNVMNRGLIPNLPDECCVEVPCLADAQGVRPCRGGALPQQLAAINRSNIAVQELAVQAALHRDRDAAFHAVALDPLTAAVVTLPNIRRMFDQMWDAHKDLLAWFDA